MLDGADHYVSSADMVMDMIWVCVDSTKAICYVAQMTYKRA